MRAFLLIPALLLAGAASPAWAFDCAKARTPLEKAICADPAAKQADDAMNDAYAARQNPMSEPTSMSEAESMMLVRNQLGWLQRRDETCRDWQAPTPAYDGACLARMADARGRLLAGKADYSGPGAVPLRSHFRGRTDSRRKAEVTIAVPQLAGGPGMAPGLDGLLLAAARRFDQPQPDDPRYTYYADYTVPYDAGTLLSVVFDIYVDHGGAHGQSVQVAVNYAPALRRSIEVGDIVDTQGVSILADICMAQLRGEKEKRGATPDMIDGDLAEQAVADGIRSIESWQFRRDAVAIHYDAYALGAYAEGPYDCVLPWAEIRQAAKPGAPLPKG